ncbi:MAG: hypothetical protein WD993_11140 [Thermoleophilaceae bacterium]
MDQILQISGALLVLAAFAGLQRGALQPYSRLYLTLNLVGALLLTVAALRDLDWGFLLLEVVWGAVSLWGLVQLARGRLPGPAH